MARAEEAVKNQQHRCQAQHMDLHLPASHPLARLGADTHRWFVVRSTNQRSTHHPSSLHAGPFSRHALEAKSHPNTQTVVM